MVDNLVRGTVLYQSNKISDFISVKIYESNNSSGLKKVSQKNLAIFFLINVIKLELICLNCEKHKLFCKIRRLIL